MPAASMAWYLSRSTGIVAALLAVASLVWGLRFAARHTGTRLRPNWWMTMHKWLGGMTLVFTLLHVTMAILDTDAGIGVVQAFVPHTADVQRWAITWGVVAMYLFVVLVATSVARVRRRIPRKIWHAIHLSSFAAIVTLGAHSLMMGSDASSSWFVLGFAVLVALAVSPITVRLLARGERHRRPIRSTLTGAPLRVPSGVGRR